MLEQNEENNTTNKGPEIINKLNEKTQENDHEKEHESKKQREKSEIKKESEIGQFEYFLFLILILLLIGNQKTLSPYLNMFGQQTKQIKQTLDAFSLTADELKDVFVASQKIF